MLDYPRILLAIGIMALVTYLPRMLPMVVFKKRITSRFVKSFLYYVPYAVLAAMTFPEVLYSTGSLLSAAVGTLFALFLAYRGHGLLTVALSSCGVVFLCEQLFSLFMTMPPVK